MTVPSMQDQSQKWEEFTNLLQTIFGYTVIKSLVTISEIKNIKHVGYLTVNFLGFLCFK